jgi:hypothetical protein
MDNNTQPHLREMLLPVHWMPTVTRRGWRWCGGHCVSDTLYLLVERASLLRDSVPIT